MKSLAQILLQNKFNQLINFIHQKTKPMSEQQTAEKLQKQKFNALKTLNRAKKALEELRDLDESKSMFTSHMENSIADLENQIKNFPE